MPGTPEGLVADDPGGILAVGLRRPDAVALVNVTTGRVRKIVRLPGAPRHLQLAGPAGPVLVPAEQADQLVQLALPSGKVVADTHVGHQPHDAAAAGRVVFVGNEYSNTVSLVRGGKQIAVEPAPLQPGGVAAARNGSAVVVVGVRGRRIEAYTPDGRPLGTAPVGVGPTHVRAAPNGLFYVADTEGDALIEFRVTAEGPHQVGSVRTECCTPYGIAIDGRRGVVYVTLTATNRLESFLISGNGLVPDRIWPAVRQPNDVAVDEATGQVFVAGTDDDQLQLIAPGTGGSAASLPQPPHDEHDRDSGAGPAAVVQQARAVRVRQPSQRHRPPVMSGAPAVGLRMVPVPAPRHDVSPMMVSLVIPSLLWR